MVAAGFDLSPVDPIFNASIGNRGMSGDVLPLYGRPRTNLTRRAEKQLGLSSALSEISGELRRTIGAADETSKMLLAARAFPNEEDPLVPALTRLASGADEIGRSIENFLSGTFEEAVNHLGRAAVDLAVVRANFLAAPETLISAFPNDNIRVVYGEVKAYCFRLERVITQLDHEFRLPDPLAGSPCANESDERMMAAAAALGRLLAGEELRTIAAACGVLNDAAKDLHRS